jgi:anti-sigma B factor antagonist
MRGGTIPRQQQAHHERDGHGYGDGGGDDPEPPVIRSRIAQNSPVPFVQAQLRVANERSVARISTPAGVGGSYTMPLSAEDPEGGPIVELALDVHKTGSLSVVDVKGEIDVYTAPKLREKLIELVSEGSYNVVVNLEGVDFLDSTGLGVLVGALKRVKAHDGTLSLVCTQEKILKIFKITGLTKVFPIHDSVESASAPGGEGA